MPSETTDRLIADVKCYFCGHISGQIIAPRKKPIRIENFVPRPGFTGAPLRPGDRLRCERCGGPVFLEDAEPLSFRTTVADEALKKRLATRREEAA
jgi:hypothetical protein